MARYSVRTVGNLKWPINVPVKLNNKGHVLGRSCPRTELGLLPTALPLMTTSFFATASETHFFDQFYVANDLNDDDVVAGIRYSVERGERKWPKFRPVRITDGRHTDILPRQYKIGTAQRINNVGTIIGSVSATYSGNFMQDPPTDTMVPCLWDGKSRPMAERDDLREPAYLGINDYNLIVGKAKEVDSGLERAAVFSGDSVELLPSLPGYPEAMASAVNNARLIVGTAKSKLDLNMHDPVKYSGGLISRACFWFGSAASNIAESSQSRSSNFDLHGNSMA